MIAFIAWYFILTVLGWLTFPLVFRLLPALADRGFTLARVVGLLLWAYAFWLFTTLGLSFNNVGGILFGLLPLTGLSVYALFGPGLMLPDDAQPSQSAAGEFLGWVKDNARVILSTEALFLVAFGLLALLRAGNPTLDNAEKPMELMFINSILRSPTFPPHDGWLSGYAISYYYFGYVMTAMLAQLSGVAGGIAHNLMTALTFALAATGSYGIVFNLLARRKNEAGAATGAALLAPLFMLVVSNVEGFLEVLHRRGLLWTGGHNFWTWLDIRELNQAPTQPAAWIPDRFWWWWRASRVISDYDLTGGAREVIDEFPFFTFLHADLHPHVLATPFLLLTIGVALNLFLGGWRGATKLFGLQLPIHPAGFFASALVLGGIAFLNIWDIVLAVALILIAYGLLAVREKGWSWTQLPDMLSLGLLLGIAAVFLYLPFFLGFASQAGGLLPNLVSPTRGAQLWVMFAPLFIPLLAYLAFSWRVDGRAARWRLAILLSLGLVAILLAALLLVAWLATVREPGMAEDFLRTQGATSLGALARAVALRRLMFIGGLLTVLTIFVPALAFLSASGQEAHEPGQPADARLKAGRGATTAEPSALAAGQSMDDQAWMFSLLLIAIAALLVIGPEFVYLRDQFGYRINTIFKFYFQAWLLWSLAAALAVAVLLRRLRGAVGWIFSALLTLVLLISMFYPVLAIGNKTNGFKPYLGWTLDDFKRIERGNPDEAAAILWLKSAPDGVVAEAVGGSYSEYGRISVYTGLPAVLGWPGHEVQWRGTAAPQGSRQDDIKLVYETADWGAAGTVLDKYDVRYVVVGGLERSSYEVLEEKLEANLDLVFRQGVVSVYEVP